MQRQIPPEITKNDTLDPDIRRFADGLAKGYEAFPDFNALTLSQARDVAEKVRVPWCSGGPEMTHTEDKFVPGRAGEIHIRMYRPSTDEMLPALVYLHGGGWTIFSLNTHDRLMREYAARSGCAVIGVDYSLSPEVKFPVALNEIIDSLLWLSDHGAEIGISPDRLALGGDSVGGNMTLAAALCLKDAGKGDILRCLMPLYGVYDRHISAESAARFGAPPYTLNAEEMESFWANYLSAPEDCENPYVQPILADLTGLPPVYMSFGTCDILAEQNYAMADKLREAGVPTLVHPCKGATHSFLEAVSISSLADHALEEGARWLASILR